MHVSTLIRRMAQDDGILQYEQEEELQLISDIRVITDPVAICRINMGLAWEEHYIPMIPEVVDHPGEMEYEGIYMTDDGEEVITVIKPQGRVIGTKVHEVKATYKSINTVKGLDDGIITRKTWMWMAQLKAYCMGLNTRYAALHVLFVCGDYTWPMRPRSLRWDFEFEDSEIESNWELLRDYKIHLERNELA